MSEEHQISETNKQRIYKFMKLFGRPPQWNKIADPRYMNDINVGRTYADTYLATPTVVSLCPCTVKYMPNVKKEDQENFFKQVSQAFEDGVNSKISQEGSLDMSGKFYVTTGAYGEYINEVNTTMRLMAICLGIGDLKFPGTTTPYKQFSWDYYYHGGKSIYAAGKEAASKVSGQIPFLNGLNEVMSVLSEAGKRAKDSIIDDWTWVHFYADGEGTSADETIETTSTSSIIERVLNEGGLNEISKEINFLLGGKISDKVSEDYDKAVGKVGHSWLGDILKGAKGYLEGSRLIFPQILDSVTYGKSFTAKVRCVSPYGDKESIYLQLLAPLGHILPFAVPGQYSANMYRFPLLCKCHVSGVFSSDLAFISNLKIIKGGPDDRSWSVDGLPTEMELSFDVTPLYSTLMLSSASKPFAAIQNESLAEYITTLTGTQLVGDTLAIRTEMLKMLKFGYSIGEKGRSVYNSILDNTLFNLANKLFKII